jgi:uncharacterized protein (TIGR02246 family)
MSRHDRPSLGVDRARAPVDEFVHQLQQAIDQGDASLFNRRFARDVLWGSPFGAVVDGYEPIHAIHERMFAARPAAPGASRYEVEHVRFLSDRVAIAYVRRLRAHARGGAAAPGDPGSFDELALFVLARRDGEWWLAAAQHVPDRRDVYAQPA